MELKMRALTLALTLGIAEMVAAAPLEKSPEADAALRRFSQATVPGAKSTVGPDSRPDPAMGGIKKYHVRKMAYSETALEGIARALGMEKDGRFGYNAKHGKYYFHDNEKVHQPLKAHSPADLESLKERAASLLENLLGKESANFVFANTESDWEKSQDDTTTQLVKQTYRFVRRLDGRLVVDNTAFARISFSGDRRLVEFEFANPTFEAVPVWRRAKPSALPARLRKFAEGKNMAVKGKGEREVGVERIVAQKVNKTYYVRKEGQSLLLVPYISVFSQFDLQNGDSYQKSIDFSEDADYANDLTSDLIDSNE